MPVPSAEAQLQDISHTIQLAVAPVFLLTAIGTTLGVLTTRLGRIVDRSRRVEGRLATADSAAAGPIRDELRALSRRTRLIHLALSFGTASAILVCLTIASAFVGYMLEVALGGALAILFILAVSAYVGALVSFLREIFIAIGMLHLPRADRAEPPARP